MADKDDSILQRSVKVSATPRIIKKQGPYTEINSKIKRILNYDCRLNPQLLELIPPLFNGSIIQDYGIALIILAAEVYSIETTILIFTQNQPNAPCLMAIIISVIQCILSQMEGQESKN
ncbi:hypothetical protein RO3G_13028 [Rhizopus delemar RA 99-880]|uniref:Uncharacterized protein n=1 Tax=Rhizopus delemar (strain RA 99-880 / ATCC MYA-4621 / FGSC 9543 / NRRL 43880) TaxID=246409 RepID=I1CIN7_RHIO9|nr:hypothetical protein RO3G_13028 [Rhizopus delemar RA 99-880]|eukprot:EIE88317.1 hypothetical protein RO3G_13028 [Rhizopus delemar RA 99-880]